jgi:hypothetical protein
MASPQSRWAAKQVRMGRCRVCGAERNKHRFLCDAHGKEFAAYMREWRKRKRTEAKDAAK